MIDVPIRRAYNLLKVRTYDTPRIYWTIDLHDTCIKSTYVNGEYQWINQDVIDTLKYLLTLPETCIIVWTSCYPEQKHLIKEFFESAGLYYHFFNENPEAKNTKTGYFNEKFYTSVLIDDKAGFDPQVEWNLVMETVKEIKNNK